MNTWEENQISRSGIGINVVRTSSRTPVNKSGSDRDVDLRKECDELPVVRHRGEILDLVRNNQVVIVCGETGSGKSTQLPQFFSQEQLVSSTRRMAITQPRRLAATSLAARVASETGTRLGDFVGYSVRFDNQSSTRTVLKYLSNGMLLRELLADPLLSKYGAILIDEAHERNVETDIMIGLLAGLLKHRSDLKLVVSSATLDAAKLSSFFNGAPIYTVPGRVYPVDVFYAASTELKWTDRVLHTVEKIHLEKPLNGDILVFLPGQAEIAQIESDMKDLSLTWGSRAKELIVVPVFANMTAEQQHRIFQRTPRNCRKVVLATNIAETSLTIPQITYVVDTGLVKQRTYSSQTGMDVLELKEVSQSSADQRAGRAGRTGPGECYRTFTKGEFAKFNKQNTPEILRANLSQLCLLLLSMGVSNIVKFPWLDPPPTDSVISAMQNLYALGAINSSLQLTRTGRTMAEFPTDPQLARALVASVTLGCSEEVAIVTAMLGEAGGIYVVPRGANKAAAERAHEQFKDPRGDHTTLLQIFRQFKHNSASARWCRDNYINYRAMKKASTVCNQLVQLTQRISSQLHIEEEKPLPKARPDSFMKALVSGYFMHSARLSNDNEHFVAYNMGTPASIHPSSVLWAAKPLPECLIYHELVLTSKPYLRGCLVINPALVQEVAPHFYHQKLRPLA